MIGEEIIKQKMSIEELKTISLQLYSFFSQGLSDCINGRYELERGIYVNIEEYDSLIRASRKYESHNRYIDFQFIISGSEDIEITEAKYLSRIAPYDSKKDIVFYNNSANGLRCKMESGKGILIYPGQAHMPCLRLADGVGIHVKKAVAKIPLSLIKTVKLLVMDVDGTLTDGKIYISNSGEAVKAFNIKDGLGIHEILPDSSIEPVILTGRKSDIVTQRCKELGIQECYQGINDKLEQLKSVLVNKQLKLGDIAYIGDDDNDLECMTAIKEAGGLVGCPANSSDKVKYIADYLCNSNGGEGAVREFIEWITL